MFTCCFRKMVLVLTLLVLLGCEGHCNLNRWINVYSVFFSISVVIKCFGSPNGDGRRRWATKSLINALVQQIIKEIVISLQLLLRSFLLYGDLSGMRICI